jgi:hypothetical protein
MEYVNLMLNVVGSELARQKGTVLPSLLAKICAENKEKAERTLRSLKSEWGQGAL